MIARISLFMAITCLYAYAEDITGMLGSPKPDRYAMADGTSVIVIRGGGHDTLKAANGQVVAELAPNEFVAEGVQSMNKKFLLCLLRTHRGAVQSQGGSKSLGSDFSGLARISHTAAGWAFQRVWKVDHVEWVRELGAVSNDGVRALFKIARKSAPVAPYDVDDHWQTWDLDKNVLVKTGLSID